MTTRGGLPICEVFSGAVGIDQADANEDLIAAAPDMFVCLRFALIAITNCNADHRFDREERMLRGTLARALGVQPERWTAALFLVDKRVLTLPAAGTEAEAMRTAEEIATKRRDVESIGVRCDSAIASRSTPDTTASQPST
ncbi:MAG TPA: hypothetical protein PLN31_20615 [Azoarcus taiwanensis]|nr:hypothetical protein [Azoarcus taiwanensis]